MKKIFNYINTIQIFLGMHWHGEQLENIKEAGVNLMSLQNRYGIFFNESNKDKSSWLLSAAERHTSGDTIRMSQRLLDDFRKNLLGNISLEIP